jgi:hypothetical protein
MSNPEFGIARWNLVVAFFALLVGFLTFLFGPGVAAQLLRPTEQPQPEKPAPATLLPQPQMLPTEPVAIKQLIKLLPGPIKEANSEPSTFASSHVDISLEHFVATYSSLREQDRPVYLQSLAGKKITWTAYISQLYLLESCLYLSERPDAPSVANVAVNFDKELTLRVAPPKSKICVTGMVEIRGAWVVINASDLRVCP